MGKFIKTQNSFANGEISPEFLGRGDNGFAASGLARLCNMDIADSGAIRPRRGLRRLHGVAENSVLVPYCADDSSNFILALSDGHVDIFSPDGEFYQNLQTPWNDAETPSVQYTQRFGTMIFTHENHPPMVLKKLPDESFDIAQFYFSVNDDMSRNIPFMRFDDSLNIKLTFAQNGAGTNYATITASGNFWTAGNVNGNLTALGKQWIISSYISPTQIVAYTNGGWTTPGTQTSDWSESAFSARRGYPRCATFHQNRLVFGGSREWDAGIWMSKVGDHYNFNAGTGLDDEAIFMTLLASKRQRICTAVSCDNLQILTTAGVWAISSKPLTPSTIDIKQHATIGTFGEKYLEPQSIENCTVFIAGTGDELRELVLDDLQQNYNARDLCAAARHLMNGPVDISFNGAARKLFVAMADGTMAVLNKNSEMGISGWARYETDGQFRSVVTLGNETFAIVRRGDDFWLEKFSDDPDEPPFQYSASGLPMLGGGHMPEKVRINKISAVLHESDYLKFTVCESESEHTFTEPFSGAVSAVFLGTNRAATSSPWEISGTSGMRATILSIKMEGQYLI
ncbi:MAG: hypothetical protein LBO08_01315 [Rickettsiales bacterium]|jgi:hypothetical protein|nr:hypothetical protein [Rickettsiales bacterium]